MFDIPSERSALSQAQRVDALVAAGREIARLQAVQLALVAELDAVVQDEAVADAAARGLSGAVVELAASVGRDWARDEVACALRLSARGADGLLQLARRCAGVLAPAAAALARGELSLAHLRRLDEATTTLSELQTAAVQAQVLPGCGEITAAALGRRLRRAVLACDPRTATEQHLAGLAARRVEIREEPAGMMSLWALLPADACLAVFSALTHAAHAQPTGDGQSASTADPNPRTTDQRTIDQRTIDQRRADTLVELPTGAQVSSSPQLTISGLRPAVQITVPLAVLLALSDAPADLTGYGPVPAELVRRIAADPTGTWRRLTVDDDGHLLDVGRRAYRPPADLDRYVRARDVTCRFPGCHRPAITCELDHCRDWADGGTTDPDNVHALCARHHHLKHDTPWTVTRHRDGTTTWTSPTGHAYTKPPERHPTTDPDPPPF